MKQPHFRCVECAVRPALEGTPNLISGTGVPPPGMLSLKHCIWVCVHNCGVTKNFVAVPQSREIWVDTRFICCIETDAKAPKIERNFLPSVILWIPRFWSDYLFSAFYSVIGEANSLRRYFSHRRQQKIATPVLTDACMLSQKTLSAGSSDSVWLTKPKTQPNFLLCEAPRFVTFWSKFCTSFTSKFQKKVPVSNNRR